MPRTTTTKAKEPIISKAKQALKKTEPTIEPETDLVIDFTGAPLSPSTNFYSLSGQSDSAKEQLADAIVQIEMDKAKERTIKRLKEAGDVYWLTDKDAEERRQNINYCLATMSISMFCLGILWALGKVQKGQINFID